MKLSSVPSAPLESAANGREIDILGGFQDGTERLSSEIISAAIAVHKELGPGLLESVYQSCMIIEFCNRKIKVASELPVPVFYKGVKVHEEGFRLDLLVEDRIVVELKSVEKVQPVHQKQLLTYLRLMQKPLGLLINFNELKVVDGVTRIANGV